MKASIFDIGTIPSADGSNEEEYLDSLNGNAPYTEEEISKKKKEEEEDINLYGNGDSGFLGKLWEKTKSVFTPASSNVEELEREQRKENYLEKHQKDFADAYNAASERFTLSRRNSVSSDAESYFDEKAMGASSVYRRFKGLSKLDLDPAQIKEFATRYYAEEQTHGKKNADMWLDRELQEIVAQKQSGWERALYSVTHLIPAIEGGLISTAGMVLGAMKYGATHPFLGPIGQSVIDLASGTQENNQNAFYNMLDEIIDNPITRYGDDVEKSGAAPVLQDLGHLFFGWESSGETIDRWENSKTEYNPNGVTYDTILKTQEEQDSLMSWATPFEALQSGGFTLLSILTGSGLAKISKGIFGKGAKLLKGARGIVAGENAVVAEQESLEGALSALKKIQNFVEGYIIPGAVGTVEGGVEGLNAKKEVEQEGLQELNEAYDKVVSAEAKDAFDSGKYNSYLEAYEAVWNKYKDSYMESREHIDWAASTAGVNTFILNSCINGALNMTLKAGLHAPRVQETLRNSRLTGWMYRRPQFNVEGTPGTSNVKVTPKNSWLYTSWNYIKEPLGEASEEYLQNLAAETSEAGAMNNILTYLENKYNPDGHAEFATMLSSDWSAALTALGENLTSKESLESALLGGLSSVMGTPMFSGRGYHLNSEGKLERNSFFDPRNLAYGYKEENGKIRKETFGEWIRRVAPWRSGLVNAIYDDKDERKAASKMADLLTEWLQDAKNLSKWDGGAGTLNWAMKMADAAQTNDQFSYRMSQMGKLINDIMTLQKLKGTQFYDATIAELEKAANIDLNSSVGASIVQKIRQSLGNEADSLSDEDIIGKLKENANKMLNLVATTTQESQRLDRLFGRMDDDTKESLIYGKIMQDDLIKRRDQLTSEINDIIAKIGTSSASTSQSESTIANDEVRKLMAEYGSVSRALHAAGAVQKQLGVLKDRISTIEGINKKDRTEEQKTELEQLKSASSILEDKFKEFKALYGEDGKVLPGISDVVLNESEIMGLDNVTRGKMLRDGSTKYYNAVHQNRQKIEELQLEVNSIDDQIVALDEQNKQMTDSNGRVKKRKNKKVKRNNEKKEALAKQKEAKLKEIDDEKNKIKQQAIFSESQQRVLDNLRSQGEAIDQDFVDKVVDLGRIEESIQGFHRSYQSILSDPDAYAKYVVGAKENAALNLTARRAERVSEIEDFQEYSQEVDRLLANPSDKEARVIQRVLKEQSDRQKREYAERKKQERLDREAEEEEEGGVNTSSTNFNNQAVASSTSSTDNVSSTPESDASNAGETDTTTPVENAPVEGTPQVTAPSTSPEEDKDVLETNFDRYLKNRMDREIFMLHALRNENLTDNDKSLISIGIEFLQSKGVDLHDKNAVVSALAATDVENDFGKEFREYVEARNDKVFSEQETFIPTFSEISQIIGNFVDIIDGIEEGKRLRETMNPKVTQGHSGEPSGLQPEQGGNDNPPTGNGNSDTHQTGGTDSVVRTGAQTDLAQQHIDQSFGDPNSEIEKKFREVAPTWLAALIGDTTEKVLYNLKASDDIKNFIRNQILGIVDTVKASNGSEVLEGYDDLLAFLQNIRETIENARRDNKALPQMPATYIIDTEAINKMSDAELASINETSESVRVKAKAIVDFFNSPQSEEDERKCLKDIGYDDNILNTLDRAEVQERVKAEYENVESLITIEDLTDKYNSAIVILQTMHNAISSLKRQNANKPAPRNPKYRAGQEEAFTIKSTNIAYLEYKAGPDAWAVKFSKIHGIQRWNTNNTIDKNEEIFFITDSAWALDTREGMNRSGTSRGYNATNDYPIVMAVKCDESPTAVEVDGQWYQPIGILPSGRSTTMGATNANKIRKLAITGGSEEFGGGVEGRHLIKIEKSNDPLTTTIIGPANYRESGYGEYHRDNSPENDSNLLDGLLKMLPMTPEQLEEFKALPNIDKLNDDAFRDIVMEEFIKRLWWSPKDATEYPANSPMYLPKSMKEEDIGFGPGNGRPMLISGIPLEETRSASIGKTLKEVLEDDTDKGLTDLLKFNSAIARLFTNVISPLFYTSNISQNSKVKPAKAFTADDWVSNNEAVQQEAKRIAAVLNGYDGTDSTSGIVGVNAFIYPKSKSNIKFSVTPALNTETNSVEYDIKITSTVEGVEKTDDIGTIKPGPADKNNSAARALRNILYDSQTKKVRDFKWQINRSDVLAAMRNDNPKQRNIAVTNLLNLLMDDIFTFAGKDLRYEFPVIKIKTPRSIVGPVDASMLNHDVVANGDNATGAGSLNAGPGGTINNRSGANVIPENGWSPDGNDGDSGSSPYSAEAMRAQKHEAAKRKAEEIKEASKRLELVDDKYYVLIDPVTGEETKYLRVSNVQDADVHNTKVWYPETREVIQEIQKRFGIPSIPFVYTHSNSLANNDVVKEIARISGVQVADIRAVVAELRTEYNKTKYGAYATPSTSIGNSFDAVTRDFLAGNLQESYPNMSKETLASFVDQLKNFKSDLDGKGITILSEGIKAFGTVTMTDADGNEKIVRVAGTLDLFGYDENGNFYIFDMKTTRDHSRQKLERERAKWSRQISLYKDLLEQTFGIHIREDKLYIIPINVSYDKPLGDGTNGTDRFGPMYEEDDSGQLWAVRRSRATGQEIRTPATVKDEINNAPVGDNTLGMRRTLLEEQYKPGYTKTEINWDNLSAEDQALADVLEKEVHQNDGTASGTGITSQPSQGAGGQQQGTSSQGDNTQGNDNQAPQGQGFVPQTGSVVINDNPSSDTFSAAAGSTETPAGVSPDVPSWSSLDRDQLKAVRKLGYKTEEDYNNALNDPTAKEAILSALECAGF